MSEKQYHKKNNSKFIDIWKAENSSEIAKVFSCLSENKDCKVKGTTPSVFASIAGIVARKSGQSILCIVDKDNQLRKTKNNIQSFTPGKVLEYPSDYTARQVEVLNELTKKKPLVVVASLNSYPEKVISPKDFKDRQFSVRLGEVTYEKVLKILKKASYTREDVVTEPGDFSRRGEVIDFWSPGADNPVRLVFDFEKISKIRTFDISTQRSLKNIEEAEIVPVADSREKKKVTIEEYMDENTPAFVFNEEILSGLEKKNNRFSGPVFLKTELQKPDIEFNCRPVRYTEKYSLDPADLLSPLKEGDYEIILTGPTESELNILSEKVEQILGFFPETKLSNLRRGFIIEDIKMAVICITDIFPYHRRITAPSEDVPRHPMEKLSGLNKGDYVVHKKFGIGIFKSLVKMEHDGVKSDFLKLKYKGEGKLYVAVENADMVQKYVGSRFSTSLDSLSGNSWKKKTFRIRESVKQLAKNLIKMYKKRQKKGFSFKPFPEMEKEFNDAFPYPLTPHQEEAVEDVLEDMESDKAMDRLVCGDVGFGKTEVSMRAAYRAVLNGKQVAFLAPTTVLARQHFHTFLDRFSNQPVIIEMLSRLVSKKRQRKIIRKINRGKVDIVIGTHKLLSDALDFPSLGLVIIDEEQQFGVKQKERLRFKTENVDILTTTATPIPRTLGMAMGRVKGFSLINTPPPGRVGIKTRVMEFDMNTVK
ncbi:MAG: DEAD/DEAH box helicase, partial [Elusimicrobiota bacterium]